MGDMEIKLRVKASKGEFYPGKEGPGKRFIFTDDLELESKPGTWTPAGTCSGIGTTVRLVAAGDPYVLVPEGVAAGMIQYEATYKLIAVPAAGLEEGQITARGVFFVTGVGELIYPAPFAITGGTGPYKNARGQGAQQQGPPPSPKERPVDLRILDIVDVT